MSDQRTTDETAPAGRPARGRGLSRRARLITTIVVAAVLLVSGGTAVALQLGSGGGDPEPAAQPAETPEPTAAPAEPEPEEPDRVHLIAMGDMLPHDSVNANAETADGYDYGQFFAGIQPKLDAADVTFCNQEVPSAGVEFGISGYPTFNAPVEFARDLREAVGCDLVNLATNHTADKGTDGIAATVAAWDDLAPAITSGANRDADEQRRVDVFEEGGISIALVSFAEYSNAEIDGVSLNTMGDAELVDALMAEARDAADVVIVSAHWGTEDSHEVNDQQRAFAQRVTDLGADAIIGTGPHVLQEVDWLDAADGSPAEGDRALVWYSLGNMLNTQLGLDQLTGVIAGMDLVRDDDGEVRVEDPTAILTYMHYDWTAEEEAANDLLARTNLSITPLASAEAADLLASTRFGVSAADQRDASAAILGDAVTIVEE